MIIVEGIDRVGKTTVAKKISEALNIKIFNNPYMNQKWIDIKENDGKVKVKKAGPWNMFANVERMNVLLSFIEQFDCENFVADRFHLSEYVYGIYDRSYMNLDAFLQIDERLAKLGAIIIYVKPKDIKWSSEQHGSDLSEHFQTFERMIKMTKCKVIECDHDTLDSVVDKLKDEVGIYYDSNL